MKTPLCKHVFCLSVLCETFQAPRLLRGGGPLKLKQDQTEEFSSQHVIFILRCTTAADLGSCLGRRLVPSQLKSLYQQGEIKRITTCSCHPEELKVPARGEEC